MTKRENPMSIRSKNALAQALIKLMKQQSYDTISISDITVKAGLSRQTFYTNFSKKDDIIKYLLNALFKKYSLQLTYDPNTSSNIILDYFLFWDKFKDFLSLLMQHNLGYLFQERNRLFFQNEAFQENTVFTDNLSQLPYIKATLAGITYELLWMWIIKNQGLSVNTLSILTENLLSGKIFYKEHTFTKSSLEKTV